MKTPEASNHIPGAATLTAREALADPEILDFVRGLARSLAAGDRPLADDLEQETLLAALRSSPRDPAAIRAWLRSIATNKFRSRLRRLRPGLLGEGAEEAIPSGEEDPAQLHRRNEVADQLARAMSRLPRGYADVVRLRVCDGLPPRTVAAELGIPVETVRSQLRRALVRLREDLGRDLDHTLLGRVRWAMLSLAPGRRLATYGALVTVGLVSAIMIMRYLGGAADGHEDAGRVVERSTEQPPRIDGEALALPGVDPQTLEQLASLSLSRAGHSPQTLSMDPMGLELVFDGEGQAPVLVELDGRGQAHVGDLRTGNWTLMAGADVVDRKALKAGAQRWEFELPDHRPIHVRVVDSAGLPRAGALVYERRDLDGRVHPVGTTDQDGRLRVTMVPADGWLAARGRPGEVSDSILIGQPWVDAQETVTLRLEDLGVEWLRVVDGDGRPFPAGAVHRRVTNMRIRCQTPPTGPTTGSSDWLPLWASEEDTIGRPLSVRPVILIVDGEGESVAWASERIPSRGLAGTIPAIRADGSIEGVARMDGTQGSSPMDDKHRSIEVSAYLAALPNYLVKSVWTDKDGRFAMAGLPRVPLVVRAGDQLIGRTDLTLVDAVNLGSGVRVRARSAVRMRGVLRGAPQGAWLHSFRALPTAAEDDLRLSGAWSPKHSTRVGPEGAFEFEVGPAMIGALVVTDQPAQTTERRPFQAFTAPVGGWGSSVELDVDSHRETGAVRCGVDPDATPATLAAVHADSGAYRLVRLSEGERTARFEGLEPGPWRVVCLDVDGGRFPSQTVTVQAGATEEVRFEGRSSVAVIVPVPEELQGADLIYVDPLDGLGARWSRFLEPEEERSRRVELQMVEGSSLVRLGRHDPNSAHWSAEVTVALAKPAPKVRLQPMAVCRVVVPHFYMRPGARLVAYGRDGSPCGETALEAEKSQAGAFMVTSTAEEITELQIIGRGGQTWTHPVSAVRGKPILPVLFPAPR